MEILAFIAASVVLTLMPGPDIIFVLTQSITNGKKAGILIALGLCTGLIVHTMAAAFGISVILLKSATAFRIIKYAGAAYLIYLGMKAIYEKELVFDTGEKKIIAPQKLYSQGIFMNLLNPKVSLFFIAFLPQFVNTNDKNTAWQMAMLGIIFIIQAIVVFTVVSILADMFSARFLRSTKIAKHFKWVKAAVLGGIGISLLFTSQ
jgi:threonine/homoserine/homoserine lactone efflux protein